MTFGSGSNGCLGHGNFTDISQVGVTCGPEMGSERTSGSSLLRADSGLGVGEFPGASRPISSQPAPALGQLRSHELLQRLPTCCYDCMLCMCVVRVKEMVTFREFATSNFLLAGDGAETMVGGESQMPPLPFTFLPPSSPPL